MGYRVVEILKASGQAQLDVIQSGLKAEGCKTEEGAKLCRDLLAAYPPDKYTLRYHPYFGYISVSSDADVPPASNMERNDMAIGNALYEHVFQMLPDGKDPITVIVFIKEPNKANSFVQRWARSVGIKTIRKGGPCPVKAG